MIATKIKNAAHKFRVFGPYLVLSQLLLPRLANRLSPHQIHNIRLKRKRKLQEVILRVAGKDSIVDSNELGTPQPNAPIWFFWMQGEAEMPAVPRLCLAMLRKNANGHPVHVITHENIQEWVDMPTEVLQAYESKRIGAAHFADALRLLLLSQRGGLWLDATMLVTAPISDEIFEKPFYSIKSDKVEYYGDALEFRWAVFCLAAWGGA